MTKLWKFSFAQLLPTLLRLLRLLLATKSLGLSKLIYLLGWPLRLLRLLKLLRLLRLLRLLLATKSLVLR